MGLTHQEFKEKFPATFLVVPSSCQLLHLSLALTLPALGWNFVFASVAFENSSWVGVLFIFLLGPAGRSERGGEMFLTAGNAAGLQGPLHPTRFVSRSLRND